jgi:OmpR-family two-component system manganese-sensing response regulator
MRILLVDDEVELTEPLSRLLRREGYGVDVAQDGAEGSALAIAQPYDLLILDWMLPHTSGLEICRQLRSRGNTTPVLFLTAKDTLDDRVDGLDAGADDYLVKPFELRELMARVRALLRRSPPASRPPASRPPVSTPPASTGPDPRPDWGPDRGPAGGSVSPVATAVSAAPTDPTIAPPETQAPRESQPPGDRLQYADLVIDCRNQIAYRGGRAIELSEKETRLLGYLTRHAERLLSHDEITNHLWPQGDKPNSNALAAQVRLLRRKIEADGEPALIHSVYGKGYRLGSLGAGKQKS